MKNHLLSLIVATSVAGCALPGERAADGACPEGEVCSPDTPQGLYFEGPGLFDSFGAGGPPGTIAVGGTQRITVLDGVDSDLPLASFEADATGNMMIAEVAPPEVTVLANEAGEGYLRIVEPGTDDLYDRILLQAEPVKDVEMVPAIAWLVDPEVKPEGWAVLAGASVDVGVRLHGATGRLVDASMTIDVAGAAVPEDEFPSWDSVGVVPDASGKVDVVVKLGDGTSHAFSFPIAEKVGEVVRITTALSPDEDNLVSPSESRYFCFRALDGDLAIAGVPWSFTAEADVELEPMGSCVSVKSKVAGDHVVTVKAGDVELAFDFEVVGAGQKVMKPGTTRPTGAPAPWTTTVYRPTPGERSRGE